MNMRVYREDENAMSVGTLFRKFKDYPFTTVWLVLMVSVILSYWAVR